MYIFLYLPPKPIIVSRDIISKGFEAGPWWDKRPYLASLYSWFIFNTNITTFTNIFDIFYQIFRCGHKSSHHKNDNIFGTCPILQYSTYFHVYFTLILNFSDIFFFLLRILRYTLCFFFKCATCMLYFYIYSLLIY